MSSIARRKFFEELSGLMDKKVTVVTSIGKRYSGTLKGYHPDTLSICLTEVVEEDGTSTHSVFINGNILTSIYATEEPFNLTALRDRLEKVFPRMVRLFKEAGIIVVMDKIRVSEKGLLEGSGPAAERVSRVYEEFIKEQGGRKKQV